MPKLKVLYIIGDLGYGGAETHLLHVLKGLDRNKFEPYVACCKKIGQYLSQVEALNIPVINLAVRKVYNFQGVKRIFYLSSFVKENRIDIIHAYLLKANILGTGVGKIAGIPVIISNRSLSSFLTIRQRFIYKTIARFATVVTAVSIAVKRMDVKLGIPPEKILTIYNGVEVQNRPVDIAAKKLELGLNPKYSIIGTVANLKPNKGYEYLFEAAVKIVSTTPNVQFLLIGDGCLRKDFEKLTANLNLEKNVVFAGHRDDVSDLLSIMDVFVLPSLGEGMSNALLEAMAAGLPCVATDVGGNPEVVSNKNTGFIVPPKDSNSLADAVCQLIRDKELAANMGTQGKKKVMTGFTIEKMVSQLEQLYSCIANR